MPERTTIDLGERIEVRTASTDPSQPHSGKLLATASRGPDDQWTVRHRDGRSATAHGRSKALEVLRGWEPSAGTVTGPAGSAAWCVGCGAQDVALPHVNGALCERCYRNPSFDDPPTQLDAESTVATLACYLPAGTGTTQAPEWDARQVAEFQAEHLARAGYTLTWNPDDLGQTEVASGPRPAFEAGDEPAAGEAPLRPVTTCACGAPIEGVVDDLAPVDPYWRHLPGVIDPPHGANPADPLTALERAVHHLVHHRGRWPDETLAGLLTTAYASYRRQAGRRPCWAIDAGQARRRCNRCGARTPLDLLAPDPSRTLRGRFCARCRTELGDGAGVPGVTP